MRIFIIAATLAVCAPLTTVMAQSPAPAGAAKAAHYSTSATDIGTLLDDPAAHAVVDKHVPGFLSNPQIDQARSMTLKDVQQYAADQLTDKALAEIDAELAKLPVKK